jgi:hypothetical protein
LTATYLSNKENLTLDGCKALKKLLMANKRLNTAYLLRALRGEYLGVLREYLGSPIRRLLPSEKNSP